MRRLAVEIGLEGSAFNDGVKPIGENLIVDIARASTLASGKGTFIPSGDHIRTRQDYNIQIKDDGNIGLKPVDHDSDLIAGATYLLKLDGLADEDGNDLVDESNWMGEDRPYTPVYHTALLASSGAPYYSPTVIELKNGKDLFSGYAYVGFASMLETNPGVSADLKLFRMRDSYDSATGVESRGWEQITPTGLPALFDTKDTWSQACCEMDDGSIIIVVAEENFFYVFRSIDVGETWTKVYEGGHVWLGGAGEQWFVGVSALGSKLIASFTVLVAASTDIYIYIKTSDDRGESWTEHTANPDHDTTSNVAKYGYHQNIIGKNGCAYVIHHGAATVLAAYYSRDGENWTHVDLESCGGEAALFNFVQDSMGNWYKWAFAASNISMSLIDDLTDQNLETNSYFANFWYFQQNGVTLNDYYNGVVCSFDNNAFFEVIYTNYYSAAIDYTLNALRCKMWSSITLGRQMTSNTQLFDICWTADAYPSSADPDPTQEAFTRWLDTGTSVLTGTSRMYLTLTTLGASKFVFYTWAGAGAITETYDHGIFARFAFKLKSQAACHSVVSFNLCSDAGHSNKDVIGEIAFVKDGSDHLIMLKDTNGAGLLATFTCTNWDLTSEYSEYVLIAKQNKIWLYRATTRYGEIVQYEKIFDGEELTAVAFVGDNDSFNWGIADVLGYTEASESYWRYVYLNFSNVVYDDQNQTFGANAQGRRCSSSIVGLAQGISGRFKGSFLVAGNEWQEIPKAIYDAENVFIWTPSVCFKEPSTLSPQDLSFNFFAPETYSATQGKLAFDSISFFGRNWHRFSLTGTNDGSLWFDILTAANHRWRPVTATASNVNKITIAPTEATQLPFFPHQFASTPGRRFFLAVPYDATHDMIFEILDNGEDWMILDSDMDAYIVGSTQCYIFTDRYYYHFSTLQVWAGINFNILAPHFYPVSDMGARLGSLVLGIESTIQDDDWESSIRYEPNLARATGMNGVSYPKQIGPARRILTLRYSGVVDQGMGIEEISRTLELSRWGVRPLVWLDDDSAFSAGSLCHHDPMLVRFSGNLQQRRDCYYARDEYFMEPNGVAQMNNNILSVDGVELEEVI